MTFIDPKERSAIIARAIEKGETYGELAKAFGCWKSKISRVLKSSKEYSSYIESRKSSAEKEKAYKQAMVSAACRPGATVKQVAEAFGVPNHRVYYVLTRSGLYSESKETIPVRPIDQVADRLTNLIVQWNSKSDQLHSDQP